VNRDLLLVSLAMMTWGMGEGLFFFFQPLYLQEMGADPLKIGTILGLVGLAMTLSFLPAGYLSDRFGRRPLLISAWIMGSLASLVMAFAPSLPILVSGMVLYGATGFVAVPLSSYLTAARGKLSVGRALTMNSAFYNLGAIFGPIIGGIIGERSGLQANFRYAACIFILSTTIVLFIRSQPVEHDRDNKTSSNLRELWHGSYVRYMLLVFFIMFGLYLPQPLSQNFLQNERGVGLVMLGQLIAARSAGVVIINLALGQLNARLGLLISQACMGLFTLFIWRGTGTPFYFVGYLLMGSFVTARGLAIAHGSTLIKSSRMGLAFGGLETAMAVAIVLGSPIAGFLYKIDPDWIYVASLIMIGLGIGAHLLLKPPIQFDLVSFAKKEEAG
jgi:MFS family permease